MTKERFMGDPGAVLPQTGEAEAADPPTAEYSVGYCRPPLATRFRPGQSGNPRGSRKRAATFGAAVKSALGHKIEVKEQGRTRRISKLEAAAIQIANRAAMGDQRAMQLAIRLVEAEDNRPIPPPTPAEELSAGDQLVIADLVRRLTDSTEEE